MVKRESDLPEPDSLEFTIYETSEYEQGLPEAQRQQTLLTDELNQ